MNPLRTPPTHPGGAADTDTRRDLRQRDIVDDAVALIGMSGTLSALEYLKSHAVEGRIIARVLLDPARRRGRAAVATA